MVIFHSYVSLPEGMPRGWSHVSSVVRLAGSESNSLWAVARLRQHLESEKLRQHNIAQHYRSAECANHREAVMRCFYLFLMLASLMTFGHIISYYIILYHIILKGYALCRRPLDTGGSCLPLCTFNITFYHRIYFGHLGSWKSASTHVNDFFYLPSL